MIATTLATTPSMRTAINVLPSPFWVARQVAVPVTSRRDICNLRWLATTRAWLAVSVSALTTPQPLAHHLQRVALLRPPPVQLLPPTHPSRRRRVQAQLLTWLATYHLPRRQPHPPRLVRRLIRRPPQVRAQLPDWLAMRRLLRQVR